MSDPEPVKVAPAAGEDPAVDDEGTVPEEESTAEFKPLVQLGEVETKTGEEDEEVLFKVRAKLFRFDGEGSWKERGVGDLKILQHKQGQKIRLLMRRDQTKKICLNHYVNSSVELQENIGSDRSWVWSAVDYADDEKDECVLAIRFKDFETAAGFRDEYNKAKKIMKEMVGGAADESDAGEDGEPTAEEKLTEAAASGTESSNAADADAGPATSKAE